MGTRTAPTYTAIPPFRRIAISVVDSSGDRFTESFLITPLATDAEVEDFVSAYQAASQASVFRIENVGLFVGDEDPDNADTDQRNSVKDGINMLYRNSADLSTFTPRVVAPQPATMQGNQDIPQLIGTPLATLATATLALHAASVSLQSMQFTERRERSNNPRIKV